MVQTNQEQTPQTGQQVTQQSEQQGTNPTPESQTVEVQQPAEEQVEQQSVQEDKPKLITYLGNDYELDNYIKQLQYNIGPYISYLKLDKNQSRILRDSFNMFIGKLKAGEVAIDDTGAWIDYAGEMANTEKGFDPWGLVVRLANMGLANVSPYQAPEPEKPQVLPTFTFNSGRGYLFSGEDPLLAPAFSGLSWDEQKNILKSFFAIDPEDITKSSIYTQWGKTYSSPFDQKDIQDTITGINTELSKDTTEPSSMLKYYLSRLGYNTASIWSKSESPASESSANTQQVDASIQYPSNETNIGDNSTNNTAVQNSAQSSAQQSSANSFESWINNYTQGVDYNSPILTFNSDDNKKLSLTVKDNIDTSNLIGQYSNFVYNILTLKGSQINNFLNKFFTINGSIPNEWSKERARAVILWAVTDAINKKYPNTYTSTSNGINYYNLVNSNMFYLMGIQNNHLKRFKWDATEYGKKSRRWQYDRIPKNKKGGTIVKARNGIDLWREIRDKYNLGDSLSFLNLLSNQDSTTPSAGESITEGTSQDQETPTPDNGGTQQGQSTPSAVVDTVPSNFPTTQIEFTGNLSDLDGLDINKHDRTKSWKAWRDERLGAGDVIFWKDNEYYSMPGTMAYTFRDNLKNYFSGSTVVANENQVPSEGNAKWWSSLLNSANAINKGLFTSINNDTNADLLKESTYPVLNTPQTYAYSPLTTNFSTQQLQRQQALEAERQQQLAADQQSDITLGLNARKSATLSRLGNEQQILAATDSQLRTDMASNIANQNKYFDDLSDLTNTNRKSIYDAQLQRAQIDAANRTKNTENVWGGVFDTVGSNIQSMFTDQIERDENIIREYWRRRGNDYIRQVWTAWQAQHGGASASYNDFLNSSEYQDAQSEVATMLRQRENYVPSASAYSWRKQNKKGGKLTYSILNKLRR